MENRFQTFGEFFPYYLQEHSRPGCRGMHYIGTGLAMAMMAAFLVTFNGLYLLLSLVVGYGFAWTAHALIEKNRPATFTYPLWSLMGDYRMLFLWLTGRLSAHIEAANIK